MVNKINRVIMFLIAMISFNCVQVEASQNILLPNPDMLGSKISECISIFSKVESAVETNYPETVQFDIQEKKVTGIMLIYSEAINIDEVQNSIDALYGKWFDKGLHINGVKVWRISPSGFTISLSKNDDNKIQVIFMQWFPSKNKQKK
jgi:hypothetical protein